jgi:uncharacterized membrane protein
MDAYWIDWANLLLRWLHLIAGVAWIGASFYFVMLDASLKSPRRRQDAEHGVAGELWAVHGGGFYRSQKFLTGPRNEPLPTDLHWSKWEAYTTWLSGMGLMLVIYWLGAATYLIDASVMALAPGVAIALSIATLAGGWLVYDLLCRRLVGRETLLTVLIALFAVLMSWLLHQVFSARAAYLHVGAMLGTMMVANVFVHIIPGQRRMVAQIRAGEPVDARPGVIGKQRSVHNTYFTLPVLFTMISNHYPMTYAHPHGWLVLLAIMLAGVLIRQFFVMRHRGAFHWWLPVAGGVLLVALVLALRPAPVDPTSGEPVAFTTIRTIVAERCAACHAERPDWVGFAQAPKGIALETPEQILAHAAKNAETIASGYMPLGNLTGITEEERRLFALWYAQGARADD